MTNTSVFGICTTRTQAERCIDILAQEGFPRDAISVLMGTPESTRDLATEVHSKAPEGSVAGATAVGLIGGALGLLAGLGSLAIPGVGPLIAAGPIMAALAGFGAGTAAGGLVGALVGLGIPEFEAKQYEGRVRKGGILLSVHVLNHAALRKAKDVLSRTGVEDIAIRGDTLSPDIYRKAS